METPSYIPVSSPSYNVLADIEKRISQYRRGILTLDDFLRHLEDAVYDNGCPFPPS